MLLSGMFYAAYTAVISAQMRRIPGSIGPSSYTQLAAGAFACLTFLVPGDAASRSPRSGPSARRADTQTAQRHELDLPRDAVAAVHGAELRVRVRDPQRPPHSARCSRAGWPT